VLEQATKDKNRLRGEIKEQENKITTAVTYFSGLEEIFVEQRDLMIKKLNADFEVLIKMVEKRRAELSFKISSTYNKLLQ